MANDVKRNDSPGRQWTARLAVLLWIGVLAVLVTSLPHPGQVWGALTGPGSMAGQAPLAAVESIVVMTAGLIGWLLVGWAGVVLAVGLIARLPGRSGRRARRLLPRIAPSAIARLVAAGVGVSLLAGTAACAAPAGSSASAGTAANASAATLVPAGPDLTPAPGTTSAAPTTSIAIDWPVPDTANPGSTMPSAPPPSPEPPSPEPPAPGPSTAATPSAATPSAATPGATTPTPGPVGPEPSSAAPANPSPTPPATAPPSPVPFSPTSESPVPSSPAPAPAAPTPTPTPPPAEAALPTPGPADPVGTADPATVTVQPGDSLWRIAAHWLGPEASDADVDTAWRAWYFTNRQVVGEDPDRLVPGQQLIAPTGQVRS